MKYILNKTTIFIFVLINIILLLANIFLSIGIDEKQGIEMIVLYYINGSMSLINLLGVFSSIILFSYPFTYKQDQYIYLIINEKNTKNKYFISKYLLLIFICIVNVFMFFCDFCLPFIFKFQIMNIEKNVIKIFCEMFLLYIYYGNLSMLLILLFDNLYILMISFSIYIFSSSIQNNDVFIKGLFNKIVISINIENWHLEQSVGYTLFIIIFLFVINYLIYQKMDF